MTIRLATALDYEGLVSVDLVAQRDPVRQALLRHHIEGGRCWVAADQERAVGFLVLEYTFYEHGFVSLLMVRQDSRRRGVGRALLRNAISICATPKLFTSTNESNSPMRSLLLEQGFEASGVIHNLDEGDPELVFFRRVRP